MKSTYSLESAVARHQAAPATFWIPTESERQSLKAGDTAKLIFRIPVRNSHVVERMWVEVTEANPTTYNGILANASFFSPKLKLGMKVSFTPEHVIQILPKE